jgi:rod shape-determining protein MreB
MHFDRYKVVRELGQGSCGKTFLAEDMGLPSRRLCVIKQLKPQINDPKVYNTIRDRFMVEARVLEKLGREVDQIPELYELVIHDEEIYLIQEWVQGNTIRDLVHEKGVFQGTEVASILTSLLKVLNIVYAKGVIHRDINPNNIILRAADSLPVLIDFGLVKEVVTTITDLHGTPEKISIAVGTKGYMAPEQALGKPVFASDLYSLGMTAVYLLTAKNPLEMMDGSTLKTDWLKYAPTVGSELSSVIEKAIQPNYLHRYANAAEMLEAVHSYRKPSLDERFSGAVTQIFEDNNKDQTLVVEGQGLEAITIGSRRIAQPIDRTETAVRENTDIELAIEVGRRTVVYRADVGAVVSEPSVLAINRSSRKIEAIGVDAQNSLLLASSDLDIVHPIVNGKVSDRRLVGKMLKHFIRKAGGDGSTVNTRVVIAIPSELTQIDRQAFIDAAYGANASEVYLVERIVSAVVGVGLLERRDQEGFFIHVGEDITEILAVSRGRRLSFKSVNSGLVLMNDAIRQYLKRKYNLLIGETTAEQLCLKLGSAYPLDQQQSSEIRGRNLIEGIPKSVTVYDEEIREALAEVVSTIVNGVLIALERTPPDLAETIIEHGMVLTGVGGCLPNLDKRISIETGIEVRLAADPISCVVTGAARMLSAGKLNVEKQSRAYEFIDGTPTVLSSFSRIFLALFSRDLVIDLGSANTFVYAKGVGVVLSEPSVMAVNKETNSVEAIGRDAKNMLGRNPTRIVPSYALHDGAVADADLAAKMFTLLIRKSHNMRKWVSPRVILPIPSFLSKVQKEAITLAAYQANAAEVFLVEQTMAAAIGAGLPITEPSGSMIVAIGGDVTQIAVISLGGIVYSRSLLVAGNVMDEAIISYMKRKYNLLIGQRTAEAIKIELGSAYPLDEPLSYEIRGRNLLEGIPKTVTIVDEEVREALADPLSAIINAVRIALERIPPELSADIVERGIVLSGGGALLQNLPKRLSIETGLPIMIADEPLWTTVLGAGKMMADWDRWFRKE